MTEVIKRTAVNMSKPVANFIGDTLTDKVTGRFSISKALSWVAFYYLSAGFTSEYTDRTIEWTDFIGYSVAVLILLTPHNAVAVIRAIKGTDQTEIPLTSGTSMTGAPEVK